MRALSPKTRDLIARGRGEPSNAADRARVRAKLDQRFALLAAAGAVGAAAGAANTASAAAVGAGAAAVGTGAAAVGTGAGAIVTPTGTFGLALKIGLAVLAIGAVGVTAEVVHSRRGESLAASTSAVASASSAPVIEASKPIVEGPAPDDASSAIPSDAPIDMGSATTDDSAASATGEPSASSSAAPSSARKGHDPASIAREVALLRRAQSALASGDPNASLRAIDAIETSHSSGALREETSAARVLALCAANKKAEAKAEAARFLAEWPSSVQASRVRGSCAFAPDGASN